MSEHQPTQYTVIGNHLTQHRALSLTAIGLGAHIQSLPDGAQVDIRTLAAKFPEGRDRIAAALRELERHGYLERVRERTSEGRIVTRTFSYNAPEITRARRRAGEIRPREAVRPPAPPPRTDPGLAPPPRTDPGLAPPRRTDPGSLAPAPPAGAVPPAPPVPPSPPPAPVPVRIPAPPRPPATQADPAPLGTRARAATSLLAELRRDDDRLLLPERDVRRLAPAVTTWLERGATPEAVRRTLSTNLPPDLRHPAALLAHRLTALLPPPLPAAQPTPPRPAVVPLQNCDGCDRAFRSPGPGLCRGCREPEDAVTPTAA
ncbi:helix-turn-helix domain-containing protein [Streptomyces sp. 5-10]|uniref:helix-turn-helix domain-containing protein n=1 Tax=Streptomyces sp. 5-10 TaxID=878925 RepID=UPI00295E3E95|nr:helix-turn-helix domain-containing protein [Streptomyces sp. 5-10]